VLVALERFDLRIPGCGSLKEKRHVVKTLSNAIRAKFNVAVAEVDHTTCGSARPSAWLPSRASSTKHAR